MINEKRAKAFCKDDISLIENYDKAIADTTQVWHCHHRRETIFSKSDLIEIGEYYNRPACELIFLTPLEHIRLHHLGKHRSAETHQKMSEAHKGNNHSDETRQKMSEAHKGKHHSAETRKKMSEALKGRQFSEETRKKLSEARKGKHHSEETRLKMSESKKGKQHSEETRKKIGEARKGNHWYNNGAKSILAKTCPEGFVQGRLK